MAPSRVVAIALNTWSIASDDEARAEIARIAAETGLPVDDPVRFGPGPLWAEIERGVDALPWVDTGHAAAVAAAPAGRVGAG